MIKVFFCEETGEKIFTKQFWCYACNDIAKRVECARSTEDYWANRDWDDEPDVPCEKCGKMAQMSSRGSYPVYRRIDTGEELLQLRNHPGACYELKDGAFDRQARANRFGPDGRALAVVLPDGHHWYIDGRASNCTMKDDNEHRCWVRHGKPEDGTLHVDKNGLTCNAGSGSIDSGGYHGFLHEGHLKVC